jgi:hypothetical protein
MECHSAWQRVIQADHKIRVVSAGLPVDGDLHPWTLDFKWSNLHPIGQPLQTLLGNFQLAARCFT